MTAPRFPTLARVASAMLMAWPASASTVLPESPADAAILLGEHYGISFEPVIEDTSPCPVAWHYRRDWHEFCGSPAKLPTTEAVYVIPTEAEGYPALSGAVFRATEATWPVYGNLGWLVAGYGSGVGSADDSSSWSTVDSRSWSADRVESHFRSVTHTVHYPGCGCGCCEPLVDPETPVPEIPIPASLPLLAGALALIAFCKRRLS